MALQHLRSSTANKRPTPASMSAGQLAINTEATSPGVFFKNSSDTLVKVGPVHVGTTAPNSSPASGGETGNSVGELWLDTSVSPNQLKTWDGSAWVSDFPDEIPVSKLADGAARQLLQTDAAGTGVEWTDNVDIPGTLDVTGTTTFDGAVICNSTGYIDLPAGTTAERPGSANSGMLRFNSDLGQFEGYDGTAWGEIGGGGGFEVSTTPPASPNAGDTYWDSDEGNAYIYYDDGVDSQWVPLVPATPPKNATGGGTDEVFFENMQTVTTNYTLTTNRNALSAGPITISSGVSVTVPSGQSWVIV